VIPSFPVKILKDPQSGKSGAPYLFTVRPCWLQGRQHCQLEGLAVGGALVG